MATNSVQSPANADDVVDARNNGIPRHIGEISELVYKWEGQLADELGLTAADVEAVLTKKPRDLKLQTYVS